MSIKFGSVCSGIEAASVAFTPLGWSAAWLSEIEPFPCAVLAHHYPTVPNHGDMTTLPERIAAGEVEAPDMLCGGTPCQAFSVAGNRQSLDDARGNLSLTFCEIADAIDTARYVRNEPACIILWENVPGVLSTKDNAFGCFLAQLCGGDESLVAPDGWPDAGCVSGPKRTAAWRVLDAQYFGLAQRRRRVFVVASARNGFDPAAVLFELEGVRRDHPPRREAWQGVTGGTSRRPDSGHVVNALTANNGQRNEVSDVVNGAVIPVKVWPAEIASTLNAAFGDKMGLEDQHALAGASLFVPSVAHTLRGDGFDAGEDGTGRGTPLVPVSVALRGRDGGATAELGDELAFALRASSGGGDKPHVLAFSCKDHGDGDGDGAPLIAHTPLVAVDCHGVMPTMLNGASTPAGHMARSGHNKDAYIVPMVAVAIQNATRGKDQNGLGIGGDVMFTLDSASQHAVGFAQNQRDEVRQARASVEDSERGGISGLGNSQTYAVRRLTPVECERLMGFPDGYTRIPYRKKPATDCPDGPRYKALGNSWAVPCVRWIGARIQRECESIEMEAAE